LRLLEEIIHTYGRGEMVLTLMIAIRLAYGQLLAARGRRDDAARVAGSLREHFGAEDPAALIAAATIYGEIGDGESLWNMFNQRADAHPRARAEIVQRLIGLTLARKPAIADLLRALEANPNRIDMLGAALLLAGIAGNRDEIRTTVARIEEIAPATLAAYSEIWTATMALASPGELAGLNQLAQQPGSPMLAIGVTRMLGASKKLPVAAARQTFRQLVEVNPGLADDAASAEAQMLLALEQTDEAAVVLAPYLDQNDPPEQVLPAIVGLRTRQGDYAATERVLRRSAERFPEQRRSAFEAIVDLKILEARHEEALALLADMETDAPLEYGLLFSRAVALAGLNRQDEALAALQRADDLPGLTPQRRGALGRKRGAVLRDSGRLDESIAAYQQAISLIPRDGAVRIGLAKTLQKAERWHEAYETMLDGVALAPAMMKTYEADLRELHGRARGEPRDGAAA
jgi:tetratricopeptide (TPR) repeat protein